jgi:hypothetical protein
MNRYTVDIRNTSTGRTSRRTVRAIDVERAKSKIPAGFTIIRIFLWDDGNLIEQ